MPETAEPNDSGWVALSVAGVFALRHSRCSAFFVFFFVEEGLGPWPVAPLESCCRSPAGDLPLLAPIVFSFQCFCCGVTGRLSNGFVGCAGLLAAVWV